jgi:enoyl-CoA hydratase/carnithine racemase
MFKFFKIEFEVDLKIAELKSKGVNTFALWNGIVMGGGVGISAGCEYRIATDKTLYAMPETRIGLFVDVAQSYYLTKLKFELGRYLSVMGHRLKGAQVLWAGLANSYVNHTDVASLEDMIINRDPKEVQEFLKQRSEVGVMGEEEKVDWLALNVMINGVFKRMQGDVRNLVKAHEKMLMEVEKGECDLGSEVMGVEGCVSGKGVLYGFCYGFFFYVKIAFLLVYFFF